LSKTESAKSPPSHEELAARLKSHEQHHLLQFWDELDEDARARLARQIAAIDLALMDELFRETTAAQDWAALARRAEPPPAIRLTERERGRFTAQEARDRGARALAAGEVGVLLTAGGQGSRLGFEKPKGLYPIGPISGASLLQIHLEKAVAAARRYGAAVPVYMMTSPITHEEQVAFLEEHDRFGLPNGDLVIFCQGTMPAVDAKTGKLLLAGKDELFLSPNGHGGTVAALADSGAIEHMRRRGIKHLFYLQVDNPLTPIADAEFIGYHLLADSELTSMAVAKQSPRDKLGNFVAVDGRVQVIEYSDFPDDVAEQRNADGGLKFWAGSIAVHVFAVDFLERALRLRDALPFHVANKKVPHVDAEGSLVEPSQPNALKFERFIFDLLPHAENAIVVEYLEQEVFAPLKNAPGAERDTPEYVHRLMCEQHRGWLEEAGVAVAEGVAVEISPLWALDAAGVRNRADLPRSIEKSTYLRDL
jgi:UDP-N-acetylglucosamine/UDP-N-acetylgalactosamine diphosphorylase